MTDNVINLRRHDFREGDVVRLKSGGPLMLLMICDADIDNEIHCVWGERRRLKSGAFLAVTVDLVARGDV